MVYLRNHRIKERYSTVTTLHEKLAGFMVAYQAASTGAAVRDEQTHARLWLAGADRVAFLQRITTNDVRLQAGEGTVTVLTSPTARIQVVFTVLAFPDGLLLLAGPDEGPKAYNALRSQIFFADDVTVSGRGSAMAQYGLYGPLSGEVLATAGLGHHEDMPLFHWRDGILTGVPVTIQRNQGLRSLGFTLLVPAKSGEAIRDTLLQSGAVILPEDAYEVLRIEAGLPSPGRELTDQVNPLEAGLRRFCDDHKGCYIGQEIIARQITYDKVTTHLVGLRANDALSAGDAIQADTKRVGFVTSAAHSPALGGPIALAYVRRPHHEPGTSLTVHSESGSREAVVTSLPFAVPLP